jgi:hypothetical protein
MKTIPARNQIFSAINIGLQQKLNRVDAQTLHYRSNPLDFFWDKFEVRLWGGAQEVANAMAASSTARVTVRAGHGTQKTFSAAHIALWFSYCWRPSKVITTAPTGRQVEKLLWSDIRKAFYFAKGKDPLYPGRMLTVEWKASPDWFMFGFSSDEPVTAEGFHGQNILIIVDEAKGVADEIFEGLEGALGGKNARLLYISTAGNPEGEFYNSHSNNLFQAFHFSVEDMVKWYEDRGEEPPAGCSTKRWVNERRDKWGEESIRYRMRVRAEFCEAIPDAIVPLEAIEKAMATQRGPRKGLVRMGVDIAEFGDDSTVIFIGDDDGELEKLVYDKEELTETAGRIIQAIRKWKVNPRDVKIDSTGLGSGVGSMLRQGGYGVDCVHFAEASSDDEEWEDIITEMYWNLRIAIMENPDFYLSSSGEMKEDLVKRKYKTNSDGAYKIESKREFKKRVKRSPDEGDAAALCYLKNDTRTVRAGTRI